MTTAAVVGVVPAAGRGRRMGADKAGLDLGGTSALGRLAAAMREAGVEELVVVRRRDAEPLPDDLPVELLVRTVEVSGDGDMADSLRAAEEQLGADCERVVVCPVDHALVAADTFLAVLAALDRGAVVAQPAHRGRPGHPVGLQRAVFTEIRGAGATLRDVVRAAPERVRAIGTNDRWVRADLDEPEDLAAARAALSGSGASVLEVMRGHRSHRAYRDEPLQPGQLERLVDAARYASTSSYIQAYAVVAVTDAVRRDRIAALCSDYEHIRQAPVFAAVCADLHKIAAACQRQGKQLQSQSLELFLQSTVDAALLGQNLALAAESEGLGICMIGAARNDPEAMAELLSLPRHCFVVFGMTIGHPTDDPTPRGRMPLAGVLHEDRYDQDGTPAALAGADEVMRAWARRINEERGGYLGRPVSETKGWVERMARAWGSHDGYVKARAALRAELASLGLDFE